ncbi:hypothetical protein JD844_017757 [Phrynosoma platyrhinos]|uniref:Uncharacterized protein n=1 Tax=Phrynosoma platyrhinos TaxID=52577 RepID=A0ABQ7SME0_PHRPL|nr:hypothetical protein JD844_017757 [Phrynosoma platyrhinos]
MFVFLHLLDPYFGDKSSYAENISAVNLTSPSSARGQNNYHVRKTPISSSRTGYRNLTPFMGYSGLIVMARVIQLFLGKKRRINGEDMAAACYARPHPIPQGAAQVITKLRILTPLEIIMSNTACDTGNATKLFSLITESFKVILNSLI